VCAVAVKKEKELQGSLVSCSSACTHAATAMLLTAVQRTVVTNAVTKQYDTYYTTTAANSTALSPHNQLTLRTVHHA
jgi:hypothetical protein